MGMAGRVEVVDNMPTRPRQLSRATSYAEDRYLDEMIDIRSGNYDS